MILAVVTLDSERVGGGAPIFYARDRQEMERIAKFLSQILNSSVHDLENDTYILVHH